MPDTNSGRAKIARFQSGFALNMVIFGTISHRRLVIELRNAISVGLKMILCILSRMNVYARMSKNPIGGNGTFDWYWHLIKTETAHTSINRAITMNLKSI